MSIYVGSFWVMNHYQRWKHWIHQTHLLLKDSYTHYRVMTKILICLAYTTEKEGKKISPNCDGEREEFPEVDTDSFLQTLRQDLWFGDGSLPGCMCACVLDVGLSYSIYVKVL